jgi:hypothetical protein
LRHDTAAQCGGLSERPAAAICARRSSSAASFPRYQRIWTLTTHARLLKLREHYFAFALWETAQELEGWKDRVTILEHMLREIDEMLNSSAAARCSRHPRCYSETMELPPMTNRQRVEVQLCRGWADQWVLGTVLDASAMKVELDQPPPDIGIPKIVTDPDICDWRPAGSSWQPEFVACDARLA